MASLVALGGPSVVVTAASRAARAGGTAAAPWRPSVTSPAPRVHGPPVAPVGVATGVRAVPAPVAVVKAPQTVVLDKPVDVGAAPTPGPMAGGDPAGTPRAARPSPGGRAAPLATGPTARVQAVLPTTPVVANEVAPLPDVPTRVAAALLLLVGVHPVALALGWAAYQVGGTWRSGLFRGRGLSQ